MALKEIACLVIAVLAFAPAESRAEAPDTKAAFDAPKAPMTVSFGFWGPSVYQAERSLDIGIVGSRLPEVMTGSPGAVELVNQYRSRRLWGFATSAVGFLIQGVALAGMWSDQYPYNREDWGIAGVSVGGLIVLGGLCIQGSASQFLTAAVYQYNRDYQHELR